MLRKYLYKIYKSTEKSKEEGLKKALAKIPSNGILLDIGCWDGMKTIWWSKAAKAKETWGIEVETKAAMLARKKKIKVFIADIDKKKWPIKSNSVDCVLSNLVIEHLTDVDKFISESSRVLKKGGYTIVSTNNLASWHNIFSLFFGWAPFDLTNTSKKAWSIGNPLVIHKDEKSIYGKAFCHKCIYTANWLKDWYSLYGLKLVDTIGSGYYPLPSFMGNIDKKHAAYFILTFKK